MFEEETYCRDEATRTYLLRKEYNAECEITVHCKVSDLFTCIQCQHGLCVIKNTDASFILRDCTKILQNPSYY